MAMTPELLERLKAVFFEESEEALGAMETGLLDLDQGRGDGETINVIFRAAHSMKGGAGSFGFTELVALTHEMETVLDAMRSGAMTSSPRAISVLLDALDLLRLMVAAAKSGDGPVDQARSRSLIEALRVLAPQATPHANAAAAPSDEGPKTDGVRVRFVPARDLMRTGNDPVLLLRELAQLGPATVRCDTAALPSFAMLDPESLYLAWDVELAAPVEKRAIEDVFAWVADDATISIEPLGQATPPAVAAAPASDATTAPRPESSAPTGARDASSIRVSIEKVDALINLVGELVITQSMLGQIEKNFDMSSLDRLRDGLSLLARNTRELQESVMRIRMLPISFVFSRFPRMVRDLAQHLGKRVELRVAGEATEIDKTVMEKIGDPLVHLVRNAVDHGIESPERRRLAGKPETGTIRLEASHQGGNIIIEIADDGGGLDPERILKKARARGLVGADEVPSEDRLYDFLFQPGFSTAETVSDVSGRGVGLDVVRGNVRALGGNVDVRSDRGRGTTFTIRLPLTLAILDGQLIRVGNQTYVVPLVSIVESLQVIGRQVNVIAGRAEVYRLREQYIPIVRLYDVFGVEPSSRTLDGGLLVVVEGDGKRAGLLVDDLLNQQQVVIKSLDANFRRVQGVSGATILGDGTVALILDIGGLIEFAKRRPPRGLDLSPSQPLQQPS